MVLLRFTLNPIQGIADSETYKPAFISKMYIDPIAFLTVSETQFIINFPRCGTGIMFIQENILIWGDKCQSTQVRYINTWNLLSNCSEKKYVYTDK